MRFVGYSLHERNLAAERSGGGAVSYTYAIIFWPYPHHVSFILALGFTRKKERQKREDLKVEGDSCLKIMTRKAFTPLQ